MDEEDRAGGYPDEDVVSHTRITRFVAPQDPAQALVFLADPELSGYINRHAWRSSTRTTPTPGSSRPASARRVAYRSPDLRLIAAASGEPAGYTTDVRNVANSSLSGKEE
jgi:hypothetical protein